MRSFLISFFVFFVTLSVVAQEQDTAVVPKQRVPVDTLSKESLADTIGNAQDTTEKKETRAERKARRKAEKEREKYYFKDILKDSARLEIERLSRVAWKRSLMLPGWGQYTNGGLWWIKVPIIYGAFVSGYLIIDYWQYYLDEFQGELVYRGNNAGEGSGNWPLGDASRINDQYLIRQRDVARRNRDIALLVTIGVYALNSVEAYVDSMLKNRWNISDDLAFKLSPTLLPMSGGNMLPRGTNFGSMMYAPGIKLKIDIK